MTVRSQRYIISPASACPLHLRLGSGRPSPRVELDMDDVAQAAWGEILQTAPASASLFAFLEDLLQPGPDLVWSGSGPGRGTEMRRSFSGLFGRFFARAYLEIHHDFVWFAALDGDGFHLSPHWRVKRVTRAEMPDWICAKPGELAIGEAKGSHQKGNATGATVPGPIRTAEGQITGVRVQKRTRTVRGLRWHNRSVKGWAVMSRWGIALPSRPPYLYALDPETEGEALTEPERDELVQAVARTHVEQTAIGLGLLKQVDDETLAPVPRRRVSVSDDPEKHVFTGAVISPFGILDLDLDQAKSLGSLLPDPAMIRFVGMEQGLFEAYLRRQPLDPMQRRRVSDRGVLGGDGLVVAPLADVSDAGIQADGA